MKIKEVIISRRIVKSFAIFCLLTIHTMGFSQHYYQWQPGPIPNTDLFNLAGNIGVGTTLPLAKLQIQDNSGTFNQPVFKAIIPSLTGDPFATIEHLTTHQGTFYGLYQTSLNGLTNYFQDNVTIGSSMIWSDGNLGTAGISTQSAFFNFSFTKAPSKGPYTPKIPQIIYPDSVVFPYKICTNNFRLSNHPITGYILSSDENGNGFWTDPSNFNDEDWLGPSISGKESTHPVHLHLNTAKYDFVGIGTEDPKSMLAVNGKITAKEVEVTLDGFPDSVFNENYNLQSLNKVEEYVKINRHLPEIPSEKEVREQGLELGRMNALLLKKVEELTLYMISMKKEIEQLKAENPSKK